MKNKFIKILSVLGMSTLLLINGSVLSNAFAHGDFRYEEADPEIGGGGDGSKIAPFIMRIFPCPVHPNRRVYRCEYNKRSSTWCAIGSQRQCAVCSARF